MRSLSVIVPTLNEADRIGPTLDAVRAEAPDAELLVADGGSTDDTRREVEAREGVGWVASPPGRGLQLNRGASCARGDLLLFLHADTRLDPGWPAALRRAADSPGFLLGAFRLCIDDPAWPFRLVEWGVERRCRWRSLPYGDQALFMKRADFERVGGFAELPLMEDVDLVRRCRRDGPVRVLPLFAHTSARRWRRHGVLRQTLLNWRTYLEFALGRPAERLALRYDPSQHALVIFCKWPEPGAVKTRLAATLGAAPAAELYRRLVRKTLRTARRSRAVATPLVFYSPAERREEMRHWLGRGLRFHPQSPGDLGARMLRAFVETESLGFRKTLIVGTDCPALAPRHLEAALLALDRHDVVVGPAHDGGYYLIGAGRPHPALFTGMEWSGPDVCAETRRRCADARLSLYELETLRDVDTEEDLRAVGLAGPGCAVPRRGALLVGALRGWRARWLPGHQRNGGSPRGHNHTDTQES